MTVLGSSSALPTSKRFTSAHVLNIHERFFLIDCGEGTQIQLRKFRIRFGRINHIFITHLHGDHTLGLFGLLSSFNLLGRENDLHVYGPAELKQVLEDHFTYYEKDRKFKIVYHLLYPGKHKCIYEDRGLSIHAIPLKHKTPTFGYLFREKRRPNHMRKEKIREYNIPLREINDIKNGADFQTDRGQIIKHEELTYPSYHPRSYAYISDTLYDESLIPHIQGINMLYHEATFLDEHQDIAAITYHSTARQAASLARKARVHKLLLGHFSTRYKHTERFFAEACEEFPDTILAEDGLSIKLAPANPNQ